MDLSIDFSDLEAEWLAREFKARRHRRKLPRGRERRRVAEERRAFWSLPSQPPPHRKMRAVWSFEPEPEQVNP